MGEHRLLTSDGAIPVLNIRDLRVVKSGRIDKGVMPSKVWCGTRSRLS